MRIELFVNDRKVADGRVDKTISGRYAADETFDIGMDTRSPVGTGYTSPNAFSGKIKQVTFELGAIPLGIRGDIERIERETRIRKAMSD